MWGPQSLASVTGKVRSLTRRHKHRTLAGLLHAVNRVLRGWCNYFRHGVSSQTFSYVDYFTWWRIAGWLRKRHAGLNWGTLRRRHLPNGKICKPNRSVAVGVYEGGRGCRVEDEDGFVVFYERHRSMLLRALTATLGDGQLAVDAADEALVRAGERWEQVSQMDRPDGWVYRVAVNWATSWRRKWSRRPTLPASILDGVHADDLGSVTLLEELAGLPLAHRQMLVLRFVFGYSTVETAGVRGVAEGTVKSGVSRARAQLRDRDGREVIDGRA